MHKNIKHQKDMKMSYREFVERAIVALRKPGYKGIHVVFSGFNEAFREYYGEDPRLHVDKLVEEGVIVSRPARKGIMMFLASDLDNGDNDWATSPLLKILKQKTRS
jgi:hypothetical protein